MTEAAALRLVLSLLLIVVLILAGAWMARRADWLRGSANGSIKVLGARSLGARTSVALVQVEDARLVLGVTSNQISLLHTLPPAPAQPESGPAASRRADFGATLKRAISRRG